MTYPRTFPPAFCRPAFRRTGMIADALMTLMASEPGEDYVYTGPVAKRMTAEQLLDSIWQITGEIWTSTDLSVWEKDSGAIQTVGLPDAIGL